MAGTVWRYGDDVDTDAIIPARYLNTSDPVELARHCMEDIDRTFATAVRPRDVIVAGENFGCGSSREHAPLAIKAAGVDLVAAASFARIFYRNAINIGLALVEAPDAVEHIGPGDRVAFDAERGVLTNVTTGRSWETRPFPAFLQEIIDAGGLVELTRRRLGLSGGPSASGAPFASGGSSAGSPGAGARGVSPR